MLLEHKKTRCSTCDKVTKHQDLGNKLPNTVRWKCDECGARNIIEVSTPASDKEFLTE